MDITADVIFRFWLLNESQIATISHDIGQVSVIGVLDWEQMPQYDLVVAAGNQGRLYCILALLLEQKHHVDNPRLYQDSQRCNCYLNFLRIT